MKVRVRHDFRSLDEYNYSFTAGRVYDVIGFETDYLRVLDDDHEPYLFPRYLFVVVDDRIPDGWVHRRRGTDEWVAYPAPLHEPGFWERYFDRDAKAIAVFHLFLKNKYGDDYEIPRERKWKRK